MKMLGIRPLISLTSLFYVGMREESREEGKKLGTMDNGLWTMDQRRLNGLGTKCTKGKWQRSMVYGPWSMVYGPWSMVYGLWSIVYGP